MDWYYLDEKPIPAETETVLRRLSLGSDYTDLLNNVLADFFQKKKGSWVHLRIQKEIANYKGKSDQNRVNGKLGGRPLKQQVTSKKKAKKTQTVSETKANKTLTTNHKPLTINQEPNKSVSLIDPDYSLLENLDLAVWETWIEYRKKIKKPPYKTDNAALKLARYPADIQAQAVQEAMDAEWTGFFPESVKVAKAKNNSMTGTYAAAKKFMDEPLPFEKKRLS